MPFLKTQSRKKQLSRRAGIGVRPLAHPPDPAREGRDSDPAPQRGAGAAAHPQCPGTAEIRPAGGSFICKAIIARGRDPRRRQESDLPADGFVISRAQRFGLNETKPLLLMKTPLMSRASKGGVAPLMGPWGSLAPGARPIGQRLYPGTAPSSQARDAMPQEQTPHKCIPSHVQRDLRTLAKVLPSHQLCIGACRNPTEQTDSMPSHPTPPFPRPRPANPSPQHTPSPTPASQPHRLALQSRKQARTAKGRGEEQTEGGRQQTDEAVRQHSHPSPREGAASADGGRVGTVGPPGIPCPSESASTPLPTPRRDFPRGSCDSPASSPASRPGRASGTGWA